MNNKTENFFIELGAVFNPKGFDEADARVRQTAENAGKSFENLSGKTERYGGDMSRFIGDGAKLSSSYLQNFFDKSSKGFLNLEGLTKKVFGNILQSFTGMITQSVLSGAIGVFGGGGLLGGLLGSRSSGGSIGKTGPYLLHAGEYVLPDDVVSSIKQGAAPHQASRGGFAGGGVNITVNTPVTVNGSASGIDARMLAEEVSQAARRGAAWAVEHAKINYKIGRMKSGEASL